MIQLNEIGQVENDVKNRMDSNWGSVISRIMLKEEYHGGLLGLKDFSHAMVITYLHESSFDKEKHLQRRPRNMESMPLLGIFSQRGKNRPNPLGITAVEIKDVHRDFLEVTGLDAINGTPVLDIKPYFRSYDRIDDNGEPEWVAELMKGYF